MNWEDAKSFWPHAEDTQFVPLEPHNWLVQRRGTGRKMLMLHGTGASSHTWRHVWHPLSDQFDCLSIDLPGQGFSRTKDKGRLGLPETVEDIETLLAHLDFKPDILWGHSAGAAIAFGLALGTKVAPSQIVALNPAMAKFPGFAGVVFPMFARLLAMNPLTAPIFSATHAREAHVRRLLSGTGSAVDAETIALYRSLISTKEHCDGALQMMARWDLDDLPDRISKLTIRTLFLCGERDAAVSPEANRALAATMAQGRFLSLPDVGHLMHETHPFDVLNASREFLEADPFTS